MFHGHSIDTITLEREIYFLAAIFNASEALSRASTAVENDPMDHLRDHFEKSEASRALVSVAVMLRSQMDNMSDEQVELLTSSESGIVGTHLKPTKSDLDFRGACNKIIHVREIHFDIQHLSCSKTGFLRPRVTLSGEYRGDQWSVEVDINRFVKIAFALS